MEAPYDDRLLHQRVVGGDEAALGEVYDRLASLIFGLPCGSPGTG